MIEYDEYDLLELFENEPKMPYEEDVGIYEYTRKDAHGYTFKMNLYAYDATCILSLFHENLKFTLYEIDFQKVETIDCKEDKLFIHQANSKDDIVVYFKPTYTLRFEECIFLK
jgi:hypothetical protein